MNRVRCVPRAVVGVMLLPLAMGAAAVARAAVEAPIADALAHCAAIAAAERRLACYDALAGHPATTAVVPAPAVAADPKNFGIAQVRVNEPPKGPPTLQARVAQVFDNGITRASVLLDNGQTWTFAEPSADASLSPGDQVTIKRAVLGSFLLVTPSKHSYHVHRVQ